MIAPVERSMSAISSHSPRSPVAALSSPATNLQAITAAATIAVIAMVLSCLSRELSAISPRRWHGTFVVTNVRVVTQRR